MRPDKSLEQDESLRLHGWSSFRSSSRDHIIPMTSLGRTLQRVALSRVLPVAGVSEGVAISVEDRALFAVARGEKEARVSRSEVPGFGETRYVSFRMRTTVAVGPVNTQNDVEEVVAIAPFDGFISELSFDCPNLGNAPAIFAIRSSSGATMFQGHETQPLPANEFSLEPDFGFVGTFANDEQNLTLRNLHMPVVSGDQITVVFRTVFAIAANFNILAGIFGFTASRQGSTSRAVFKNSMAAVTEREQMAKASQPPKPVKEAARPQRSAEAGGPVGGAVFEGSATAEAGGGGAEGKTYVQAWMPTQGAIGYLIPKPPPGGRVNVFNGRYTIWSSAGQNMGEGPVEWVRNESEIPGATQVSRGLGVVPSPGLPISVAFGGELVPGRVVQPRFGRAVVVPVGPPQYFG